MINRFFPSVALVEVDSGISLDERKKVAHALSVQTTKHFSAVWNTAATVRAMPPGATIPFGEIEIRLVSKLSIEGALGFHDEKDDGTPIAYVSPELCAQYGTSWSSCASHEVLELLADPYLRLCVQMDDGVWDREVCDRVESEIYKIEDVEVSNFNFPEAFEPPNVLTNVQYDWMGTSTRPNEVRPGGYAQRLDSTGWVQVGEMSPLRSHLAGIGMSRGKRRHTKRRRTA